MCEHEFHCVLDNTCLNQDRYSNNDEECKVGLDWHCNMVQFYKKTKMKYLNNSSYI